MILAMVFRHLKATLMFVFLNIFVTLRICGKMYVNVAHLLFLFVLVCNVVCLSTYSLGTILHPNPPPKRQTYSGTKPRRNKPTISNGL